MTVHGLRVAILASLVLATACASDPADRLAVAQQEAARMAPPDRPLSEFRSFTLAPVALAPAVEADPKKVAQVDVLQEKLRVRLQPLLDEWNTTAPSGQGALFIEPTVQQLRIVSGGARFWGGAMAGESIVDLDLRFVERESGREHGRARIVRGSGAMAGGWSVGATDRNLLDYIADIAHEYLRESY